MATIYTIVWHSIAHYQASMIWWCSSGVEHRLDKAGVGGSKPSTTIDNIMTKGSRSRLIEVSLQRIRRSNTETNDTRNSLLSYSKFVDVESTSYKIRGCYGLDRHYDSTISMSQGKT